VNTLRLILRNLWYFRKQYLAVLGGAAISIAVLTGALIVGDSVRFSLQKLTDIRLGKTRYILQSGDHLFRQKLAEDLSAETKELIAPVLFTEGIAINSDNGTRINRAEVIGIDEKFSEFWGKQVSAPTEDEAFISANVFEKLGLKLGDEFLIRIRKKSNTLENAPFSSDQGSSVSLRLKVKGIAGDDTMGRFSLKSDQSAPFNIFLSIDQLNRVLDLSGKANLLLIPDPHSSEWGARQNLLHIPDPHSSEWGDGASILRTLCCPEDLGLTITQMAGTGQYEITSERIFLDDAVSAEITTAIPACSCIFTYLANSIETKECSTPYSFVTAADSSYLRCSLKNREMIINEWLAKDLQVKCGDSVTMKYYEMGTLFRLTEKSARFVVRETIPMTSPLCDPSLMPDFPGMTNAGNCRDWETATPVDLKRIRDKDEAYWKTYRGTPKAFISLEAGQELWKNRFGTCTAFRFKADEDQLKKYEKRIMQKLDPASAGLQIVPVYENGQRSAANSTDFGNLFLGLSFVIIVSGLLLMALVFSIHTHTRLAEAGTLSALGFRKNQIIRIMAGEAFIVLLFAGFIGSLAGIGYNKLILLGLNTLWQESVRTTTLEMNLSLTTLIMGIISGILVALLILLLILARRMRDPLIYLLRYFPLNPGRNRKESILHDNFPGFFPLVMKNTWINRKRTISAIILLSIGVLTIIITGMNRKIFPDDIRNRKSGTGGFLLWAETTIPIRYDLNNPAGKKQSGIDNDTLFKNTRFMQMIRLKGEDASCLNLNRAAQPVLLGVDAGYLDSVSAFSFASELPLSPGDHPWKILKKPFSDHVIPGIADATVIKWGLGISLGDTLLYMDETGQPLRIRLVADLDNSAFQGNILISDSLFRIFYPSVAGSDVMLVDGPPEKRDAIVSTLERNFTDYGMMATSTAKRLDEFNSVQNTYLSVFMLLGGLGVIIGTFGLGFLLLRNIQSRQHEIALYSALGFTKRYVTRLLVAEHLFILITGILLGVILAMAAGITLMLSGLSAFPFSFLISLLLLIFLTGFLWIIFPVKAAMKRDLIGVLRKE
jgi:putative ABC transport system permease protein